MRIVQLIDSLEAGGAERMAVNYANALSLRIEFSALVSTRAAGPLQAQLTSEVSYLCLNKKSSFDVKALFRLKAFIKKHRVQVIQAHSSSFFWAVLAKLLVPGIKVVWQDHYGESAFLNERKYRAIRILSVFFDGIIAVNDLLRVWSLQQLKFENALYLPNFAATVIESHQNTILKGHVGKRILCLANLRVQKNHFLLLEIAILLKKSHADWTFHLVGKDFKDDYSTALKERLKAAALEQHIFIYDSCTDTAGIIQQAKIAILTSDSEGLPVALLEYGWHKKPVVVTAVGQVSSVVVDGENGFLVEANDVDGFYERLVLLLNDERMQERFATALYQKITHEFSAAAVLEKYLEWLKETVINE